MHAADAMEWGLLSAGLSLLLLLGWDVFKTVFSLRGAGLLTYNWTRLVWRLLIAFHNRIPCHRTLSYAGPGMLAGTVFLWYWLLFAAWMMIFASSATTVLNSTTGEAVHGLQKLYFIGVTASGLGYGDLIPARFPWTALASLAGFSATILLSVAISYVLSVMGAGMDRKLLAHKISRLGSDAQEMAREIVREESRDVVEAHLVDLSNGLDTYAHRHLAYPILHFFHDTEPQRSATRAVLELCDALFLVEVTSGGRLPNPTVRRLIDRAVGAYEELTYLGLQPRAAQRRHPPEIPGPLERAAEAMGAPRSRLVDHLAGYAERRAALRALCAEDGWRVE